MPKRPNLTLLSQGHHLNKWWWAWVPNATYQVSRQSAWWFWRRRFFEEFFPYMGMVAILAMWLRSRNQTFASSHMKFGFISPVVSDEMMFENFDRQQTISSPLNQRLRWANNRWDNWIYNACCMKTGRLLKTRLSEYCRQYQSSLPVRTHINNLCQIDSIYGVVLINRITWK